MIVPIKTLKVDTLTIHVYNSRQDMGIAAYELYKKHVRELMARQKIVRAIFAAAHSQDDFFMGHRTKRFFQWSGKMGERF